jgi:hypothetical protein
MALEPRKVEVMASEALERYYTDAASFLRGIAEASPLLLRQRNRVGA